MLHVSNELQTIFICTPTCRYCRALAEQNPDRNAYWVIFGGIADVEGFVRETALPHANIYVPIGKLRKAMIPVTPITVMINRAGIVERVSVRGLLDRPE